MRSTSVLLSGKADTFLKKANLPHYAFGKSMWYLIQFSIYFNAFNYNFL